MPQMKNIFTIFSLLIITYGHSISAKNVTIEKSMISTGCIVYSGANTSGTSAQLEETIIYSGSSIPNGLDNKIKSFVLKKGFMATFAVKENGTGKSKVYIAADVDLTVNTLPLALQGTISFIRVLPWVKVNKKGTGGLVNGVDASWFYDWGSSRVALPNYDYVPMTWGSGATSPTTINLIIQKEKATHLLGFNESDNCNEQSGQYNNLCQPDVAVAYFENIMSTGLRLGSPAPRENGPTGWLRDFNTIAKTRDVRFDFVAVHWYDWGGNPQSTPNADPQQIFNRFKAYLNNVYKIYDMPIWITEFNANPHRANSVHAEFLKLALPYLEQLDYVERYAFFQPNPVSPSTVGTANFFDANGNITNIGLIYKNQISTPAIKVATLASPNNLVGMDNVYVEASAVGYEAENATLVGASSIVNCGKSSGGKQVNLGLLTTNGIRFNNVVAQSAGTFRLTLSYMSAVTRVCRLIVNDVEVGVISVVKSGEWCFNNGATADFKTSITLKSGENSIEFRPTGLESPFIDKINIEQEYISLEAETAELIGTASIESCAKASNGSAVNLATSTANGLKWNAIEIPKAGVYVLDVSYVTKFARDASIFVNGNLVKNENFDISGNWCFEDGIPRVKSIDINLNQGTNTIEIKPSGSDSPFLDKIAIIRKDGVFTSTREELLQTGIPNLKVYPNPTSASENTFLEVNTELFNKFDLQVYDVFGKLLSTSRSEAVNQPIRLKANLVPGMYLIVVKNNTNQYTQKLIVR
jgi:hypothetical protein